MVQNTTYRIVLFFLDDKFIIDFKQKERCLIPFFPDHTPQSPVLPAVFTPRAVWKYRVCYITCLPRLCTWRAFAADACFRLRTFALYILSWLTLLTALRSFMPYVPWSLCALTTRFAPHICGTYSSVFKCDNISY